MFGGYARYRHFSMNQRWLRPYRLLPAPLRRLIRAQVATTPLLSAGLRRKLQHTFIGRGEDLESLYLDNFYSAFSLSEQRALFRNLPPDSPYAAYRQIWDSHPTLPDLPRLLLADQKTYLVELLMKQDQMSMATSIESRVPFLDHTFVEFAASVPDHMKLRNGEGKYIVKKAIEDLVPHDIIYRKKMGFPTPLRDWLLDSRAGAIFSTLLDRKGLLGEHFDRAALETLLERQRSGKEDGTDRIWRLLNLQLWGDIYITGRRDRHEGLLAPATAGVA
jgi:asparagine synthase (glutamine-hydrolysing)